MYFEVFIPAPDAKGFDVSVTVDADNWMAALKTGLARTGEGTDIVRNLMCDIKDDNSIHVTDAVSRRVFVLREVSAEDYQESLTSEGTESPAQPPVPEPQVDESEDAGPTVMLPSLQVDRPQFDDAPAPKPEPVAKPVIEPKAAPAPKPEPVAKPVIQPKAAPAPKPEPAPKPVVEAKPVVEPKAVVESKPAPAPRPEPTLPTPHPAESRPKERMRVGSATHQALREKEKSEPARVMRESRSKSDSNRAVEFGRRDEKVSETLIEDIFLEIQEIHEGDKSMEEVVNFVMDMAMEKIGAESGSVLFADVNGLELYFATARGPKAREVMDFRVPMGQGIVGFCTREGVSLAISDVQNDPRFYKQISESIGYQTYGLLCAPVQHEGRVYGAIEVMNKKSRGGFSADETNALAYIGRQLAQYVHDEIMRNEQIN